MDKIANIKNLIKYSTNVERKDDWKNIVSFFAERGLDNKANNFIEVGSDEYKFYGGTFLFSVWSAGIGGTFTLFKNENDDFDFLSAYKDHVSISSPENKYNFLMKWPEDKSIDVLLINDVLETSEEKKFDSRTSLLQVALPALNDESIIILNDFEKTESLLSHNLLKERGYSFKEFGEYTVFYSNHTEA